MEDYKDLKGWTAISMLKQMEYTKESDAKRKEREIFGEKDEDQTDRPNFWMNPDKALSPVDLYKYLKARFGPPNGFIMIFKDHSTKNIIHWHYSLETSSGSFINILGKTAGLEITIKCKSGYRLSTDEWKELVIVIKTDFRIHGKKMKEVQNEFEHWSLFINPFNRIDRTLQDSLNQLDRLNLEEVAEIDRSVEGNSDRWGKEMDRWLAHIGKAASLGTTIRMLCPVLAESFVNYILLIFRKDEFKSDDRLYQNMIRQEIDVRVKMLHINCICFPKQIDVNSPAYKAFHTLMNNRNNILHGNVDPYQLMIEDVYFDFKYIPLFKSDEGHIKRMNRNYCTNVEPEKAKADYQAVSDFIELVLMSMEDRYAKEFAQFMADRMPGINHKTKRLGSLFPIDHIAEGFVF